MDAFEQAKLEKDRGCDCLEHGLTLLQSSIEKHAEELMPTVERIEEHFSMRFKGFDFSFAPFPTQEHSIGHGIELMGVGAVGMPSTLSAVAQLTSVLERFLDPSTLGFECCFWLLCSLPFLLF